MIRRPIALVTEILREHSPHEKRSAIALTGQSSNRRADEQLETNQRAYRIARQSEDQLFVARSEEYRLPRFHGYLVKTRLDPEFLQHPWHKIEFARRDAAGQDKNRRPQTI